MRGQSSTSVRILRWHRDRDMESVADEVVAEEPLEIQVDTVPLSVTMRTPGNDDELAAGFLLTEGVLKRRGDIQSLRSNPRNQSGNVINVLVDPTLKINLKRLTRHVFASSSCGLCGKASIEAVHQLFAPVKSRVRVTARQLLEMGNAFRQAQAMFNRTGGLHAAALFTAAGELVVLREDVGRHNALDKVLGHGFLNQLLPWSNHILLVSGRVSFEIVQKALAGRIPVVAAVSAPSSLAIRFAKANGQTLVGFMRDDRLNVYAGFSRVR